MRREPSRWGAVSIIAAAAALTLSTSTVGRAGPAYTADDLLNYFQKQKAIADAAKAHGATRRVCFQDDDDPDCAQPKSRDLLLSFEFDSDRLTPSAKENLGEFAKMLRDPSMHGARFEIDGFTDATGNDGYNQALSERRAKSALAYLLSMGAPRSALLAKGFGKTHPRAADPFSAENRRVEGRLAGE